MARAPTCGHPRPRDRAERIPFLRGSTTVELTAIASNLVEQRVDAGEIELAGFPCRWGGCRHVVHVSAGSSMSSLFTASDERRQHELAEHGLDIPKAQAERSWTMSEAIDRLRIAARRPGSAVPGRVS